MYLKELVRTEFSKMKEETVAHAQTDITWEIT